MNGYLHELIAERQDLIEQITYKQQEMAVILNYTDDGMIAINREGRITLFNKAAEKIMGLSMNKVMNTLVDETIPNSRLKLILQTGKPELNQQQELNSGIRIITNRIPIRDQQGQVIGAVAVFRDITEVTGLTRKITDLRDLQSLFEAIINSSNDAISVVDEFGNGIMINPAYTNLTGLSPHQVIGMPADVDISEGESMHLYVLKTGKSVRGVPLKVGNKKREVLVNAAPIFIDGKIKGSVAIIHDTSEIKRLTADLEQAKKLIRSLQAKYTFEDIIGKSTKIIAAMNQAKQAATTTANVLLRGESGTGKELFAHGIHHASTRHYAPFIRVNCAALSESLLESELFGYVEGAFTGAQKGGRKGLFEEANGGTIFLDEIGELSINTQAKILRVLQEKEIIPVGGTRPIPVDVRIIAATNVNLEKAIEEKKFREDLYYRLNVLPVIIPPLRERTSDLEQLTKYLIEKINLEYGRNVETISSEALKILKQYDWPGNVRELENIIGRSLIFMGINDKVILPEHLPQLSSRTMDGLPSGDEKKHLTLQKVMEQAESNYISQVLHLNQGNKTETAKQLGISLRSLYYKIEKLKLE